MENMRWVIASMWFWQASAAAPPITFVHDIAPILYKRCISCHRDGEVGPFPLVSYADAAKRASLIAKVTGSRYMPPWKPAPGYGDFAGARALTRVEIDTISGLNAVRVQFILTGRGKFTITVDSAKGGLHSKTQEVE